MSAKQVRPAVNAGPYSFYPSDPEELTRMLSNLFSAVEPQERLDPLALVCPHAGYVYSGQTAAYGYKTIEGKEYDRVIVLAPSHYVAFAGASIFEGRSYATPLGEISLDTAFVHHLRSLSPHFAYVPEVEMREHSLEVQLPFLQHALGAFRLVPIMIFDRSPSNCQAIAEMLGKALADAGGKSLVVASTDLYHGPSHRTARLRSEQTAAAIAAMDADSFARGVESERYQACGAGPVTALLFLTRALGATQSRVLHLTTSYEVSPGNDDWVVGYVSVALW